MKRLEGRIRKLETISSRDELPAVVMIDPSEDERKKRLDDYINQHGREPKLCLVVRFVGPDRVRNADEKSEL